MSDIRITLSANAGVAIHIGGLRIWVDALHDRKQPGFSAVSPQLQKRMLTCEAFQKPDVICFTHCHPDHFSREMTLAAGRIWPGSAVIVPGTAEPGWLPVTQKRQKFVFGDVSVTCIRLPHEGEQYADVLHYGILIACGGRNVLLPGDCATASPALSEALQGVTVDTAIMDFPWAALPRGRQYLQTQLRPQHLLLCHLPFAEDDVSGYRAAAEKGAARMTGDVRLLWEPLQEIQV